MEMSQDQFIEFTQKLAIMETKLENMNQTMLRMEQDIKIQDKGIHHKDDSIGRMDARIDNLITNIDELKKELRSGFQKAFVTTGNHNNRITTIEQQVMQLQDKTIDFSLCTKCEESKKFILDKIDTIDINYKKHIDFHENKQIKQGDRSWQLWTIIIVAAIGIIANIIFFWYTQSSQNNENQELIQKMNNIINSGQIMTFPLKP